MKDIQPKIEEVREYTAQDFLTDYNALCLKRGFRVVVSPAYVARDDGSSSTVLQYTVGKMPKAE